jgi:hypothetical protein
VLDLLADRTTETVEHFARGFDRTLAASVRDSHQVLDEALDDGLDWNPLFRRELLSDGSKVDSLRSSRSRFASWKESSRLVSLGGFARF